MSFWEIEYCESEFRNHENESQNASYETSKKR